MHFAVYIGSGRVLHTSFDLTTGEDNTHNEQYFRI
jgi:hypothetical protein